AYYLDVIGKVQSKSGKNYADKMETPRAGASSNWLGYQLDWILSLKRSTQRELLGRSELIYQVWIQIFGFSTNF
ncbi:MAG: hypothetical protein ACREEM_51555, partial [Blastocatellia bacterium]